MINYIIRMQAYTVRYGVQVVIENRKSTPHTLNNALLHCMDAYWINKIITQLQQQMVGMKKKKTKWWKFVIFKNIEDISAVTLNSYEHNASLVELPKHQIHGWCCVQCVNLLQYFPLNILKNMYIAH